jgi:hypothetical protein
MRGLSGGTNGRSLGRLVEGWLEATDGTLLAGQGVSIP